MGLTAAAAYAGAVTALQPAGYDVHEARATARELLDSVTEARQCHLLTPELALGAEREVRFRDALAQLLAGVPLAFVLGAREFYGRTWKCDRRALIPRPETELLVDAAVARLRSRATPLVADIGTGTGCIGLSVALEVPEARVYLTDVDVRTLQLACENAAVHQVQQAVFVQGEAEQWARPLTEAGLAARCDALLVNPPYIATPEIATLQVQVREHEPRLALDGGADGLGQYRLIATQCLALLAPDGFLMAELGEGQYSRVRGLFEGAEWAVEPALRDFQNIERVLVASHA